MIRKLAVVAAAAVIPASMLAFTGGIASAKTTPVDVSNASIACNTVTGTAKFSPALIVGGTSGPETTKLKVDLGDCTVSGATVSIASGSGKGTLTSATNSALALLGPTAVSGSVSIKWKATGAKLSGKSSTVTLTVIDGGTPADGYASLAVPAGSASVTGDFTGGDSGAASTLYAETTMTTAELTTSAIPPAKGLKGIALGTDGSHGTGNSLDLG